MLFRWTWTVQRKRFSPSHIFVRVYFIDCAWYSNNKIKKIFQIFLLTEERYYLHSYICVLLCIDSERITTHAISRKPRVLHTSLPTSKESNFPHVFFSFLSRWFLIFLFFNDHFLQGEKLMWTHFFFNFKNRNSNSTF